MGKNFGLVLHGGDRVHESFSLVCYRAHLRLHEGLPVPVDLHLVMMPAAKGLSCIDHIEFLLLPKVVLRAGAGGAYGPIKAPPARA